MKKILLLLMGVLLLSGCGNNETVAFYENTKAGGEIDSYQLDLRIYGLYDKVNYSEIVKIDNFKGTQFKIDYISANNPILNRELPEEDVKTDVDTTSEDPLLDRLLEDKANYVINDKFYEKKDGEFNEVKSLLYSNPDAYLKAISKGNNLEFLVDEKAGEETYKVYTFEVSEDDMKPILEDGVLKDIKLKGDVSAKLWINKDSRVYRVIYYIKDGTDKIEINAGVFRINLINDMSKIIR